MKTFSLFTFLICCSAIFYFSVPENNKHLPMPVSQDGTDEPEAPDLAVELENLMTMDPIWGRPTPEKLVKISENLKRGMYKSSTRTNIQKWEERGPNNVGGRSRTVLIDANDPTGNTVWAGSASGGLWKSTNFMSPTIDWEAVEDFLPTMAVSCLFQDPNDAQKMYFGTGEGWFNGDAVSGLGIWKTVDGGDNWSQLASTNNPNFFFVQKIKINSQGFIFASTRSAGLQRSKDGGITWEKILGSGVGGAFSDRAADVEISNDDVIFASLGIFSTDGIYKSMNNGDTWLSLNSSILNNGLPKDSFERIELAVAPSDPLVIYAAFQDSKEKTCKGIYMSRDGGINWEEMTVPEGYGLENFAGKQAWYDLTIAVDPIFPYTVYIGGIDLLRSIDGGKNWSQLTQWYGGGGFQTVHADQHEIVFFPNNRYSGIAANDGGVYRFDIDPNFDPKFNQQFCIPRHEGCCNDFIQRVQLHTLLNYSEEPTSTEIDGYSDFTGSTTTLEINKSYRLDIVSNNSWDLSKIGAWVDWNQNGKFEEDENILSYTGIGPYSTVFTVPNNTAHGKVRMRIRLQYSPDYTPNPCALAYSMGETEDYSIIIKNCFVGNVCNDMNVCTTDDALDANCNCVGSFIDINNDNLCDLVNIPIYKASNNGFNVTQFYSCDYHPDAESNSIIGGTQDNGTQYFTAPGINSTYQVTGGDGGYCFIDKDDPNIQVSSYIYNSYFITNNTWTSNIKSVEIGDSKGLFINPCDYDSKSNTLIGAYSEGQISRIRKVGSDNISDTLSFPELAGLSVTAVKMDPNQENKAWLGTSKTYNSISSRYESKLILLSNIESNIPKVERVVIFDEFDGNAFLRSIDVSASKANSMIINFSNYGVPSLWRTSDGGLSWINIEGNLPDIPIRWVLFNPIIETGAFIATELGVWQTISFNGANTIWEPMIDGLANVKTNMLKYRPSDNTLFAATHGRGIFTLEYCADQINLNETICSGETYDFFGEELVESGNYEKLIFDPNSCFGSINYNLALNVEEMDIPILEFGDTIFLDYGEEFVLATNVDFASYLWSDGSIDATLAISDLNLETGEHEISLSVISSLGCEIFDTIIVVISEPSGSSEVEKSSYLNVFPNPTTSILYFESNQLLTKGSVNVYRLDGKLLSSQTLGYQSLYTIDFTDLTSGIYILKVLSEEFDFTRKIIKI